MMSRLCWRNPGRNAAGRVGKRWDRGMGRVRERPGGHRLAAARLAACAVAVMGSLTGPAGAQTSPPGTLTLTDAVEAALRSHPAAEGARARREGASALLGQARAAWLPSLGIDGTLARFQEPMVVAPLHGFDPAHPPEFDRTLLQGNLFVSYTLFDGGARRARVLQALAGEAGATAWEEGTAMELAFQVSEAYLSVLTSNELLGASSRQREALEAERRRVEQFLEEGKAARVELLRVEAALSRTEAGEISARAELELALGRLARLTTLPGEQVRADRLVPPDPSPAVHMEPGMALELARSRNPLLSRAREELAAASAFVREAGSAWLPRLEAGARYSDYGTLTGGHTLEWQGSLRVSYPVFTGGARVAEAQRARADARVARENLRMAELQVEEEVEAALAAVKETRALREALESAAGQSEEVARIEALALEAGAGVQTDFIRAEADLLQARAGLARARHREILARIRLALATGELTVTWLHENLEVAR
jgi:outer membrane protein TolC